MQFECQEEALETALVAIGELKDQLDSSNITRGGKRRRAEQAEPTIDLDNITKREARGAFSRWKCWALVQVVADVPCCSVMIAVSCAGVRRIRILHEGSYSQDAAHLVVFLFRLSHAATR